MYLFDDAALTPLMINSSACDMTLICTAWNTSTKKKKKKHHRIHLLEKHRYAFGIHKCSCLFKNRLQNLMLNNIRVVPSSQKRHSCTGKVVGLQNTVLMLTAPRQTCLLKRSFFSMALPRDFKALFSVLCKMSCAAFSLRL